MKYLIIFLLGLVVGAGAAIFLLGVPRAKSLPGKPVAAPQAETARGTVTISLSDSFVNDLLGTVFRDLNPPSFNLGMNPPATDGAGPVPIAFQGGCNNSVTLAAEAGNTKTQVQFANGSIAAPLVFSGNYNLLGNCIQFKGWAQTSIQLSFDQSSQTVYGRVNVDGVNLEGVNPLANNFVTVFVRNAIDQRVNPLEVIRPSQLQLMIPVKASNGAVKAQVKDVRSDAQNGQLRLFITYEFAATKDQPQG
jgi:hypothetical protein